MIMRLRWKNCIVVMMTVLIAALVFVMPYSGSVFADADVKVSVKVSFTGSGMPSETFRIQMTNEDSGKTAEAGVTLSAGKKNDVITLDPGDLPAGIHKYELRQLAGTNPDITYSDKVYEYYIQVNEDGTVRQKAVNKEDPSDKPDMAWFANSYRKSSSGDEVIGDPPVRIRKDISLEKPKKPDRFVFIMKPENPEYPLPDVKAAGSGEIKNGVAEVYLNGEGEIEIGNITFNKEGTYRYFVSEKDTAVEGYNYDDARYTVIYVVARDQDGKLTCERTITGKSGGMVDECAFDNIYHPNPVVRKVTRAVKTGDPTVMWPITVMCVSAIAIIALVIDRRNRRETKHGKG